MLPRLLPSSWQHLQRKRCAGCMIARRKITSAQKRALQRNQADNNNCDVTTTTSIRPSPSTQVIHKNIPKAPHMQTKAFETTSSGKRNVFFDKPLVFAIFVFPTVMMGIALIIRPDFRAQILGSGGEGDVRTNASINVPKDAPVPAYEGSSSNLNASNAEGVHDEEEVVSRHITVTSGDNQRQIDNVSESKTNDLIFALGFRPHPSSH